MQLLRRLTLEVDQSFIRVIIHDSKYFQSKQSDRFLYIHKTGVKKEILFYCLIYFEIKMLCDVFLHLSLQKED